MTRHFIILTAIAGLLSISPAAQAQPGPRGKRIAADSARGGGPGGGKAWRRGGRRGCRGMMFAHPEVLKERFKLTDAQIKKLQTLRDNMLSKRITHTAAAKQQQIKLRSAMQAEVPDEARVLALHRKLRAQRGKAAEEGIKARIKIKKLLTPEQRKQIRMTCSAGKGGKGRKWARRGGQGFGKGYGKGHGRGMGGGW